MIPILSLSFIFWLTDYDDARYMNNFKEHRNAFQDIADRFVELEQQYDISEITL